MEAVPGGAGLAKMHAIKLCSYSLDNTAHAGIRCLNLTDIADLSVPAGFRNRIFQLGGIDSNKSFFIISHGLSSCDEDRLGLSE